MAKNTFQIKAKQRQKHFIFSTICIKLYFPRMLQQLVSLDCLCHSQLILLKIDTESKTCDGKGT